MVSSEDSTGKVSTSKLTPGRTASWVLLDSELPLLVGSFLEATLSFLLLRPLNRVEISVHLKKSQMATHFIGIRK